MFNFIRKLIAKRGSPQVHPDTSIRSSRLGKYTRLKSGVEIIDSSLGDYSYACQNTIINGADVGKFCSIAAGCFIGLWEHDVDVTSHSLHLYETSGYFVKGYKPQKADAIRTRVGSDVWIGANTVILKGVVVGDGAIIGAGSVVCKDVPPYSVVAGNPARFLRFRFSEEEISQLLIDCWWDNERSELELMVKHGAFNSLDEYWRYSKERKGS